MVNIIWAVRVLGKKGTQLNVIGTDDVHPAQRIKAIRKLLRGAQIRHRLPDEQGSCFDAVVGLLA